MEDLIEEARLDAKAFRENPIYDSEGDPIFLSAVADRLDAYATALAERDAELAATKAELARMREALAGISAFGKRHPGHGYSCYKLAEAPLTGDRT